MEQDNNNITPPTESTPIPTPSEATEQAKMENWLEEEQKNIAESGFSGEILPGLKLESGKITTFTVDFSEPFAIWTDDKVIKKILKVEWKGEKRNLWLNVKNPLYKEIVTRGVQGQTVFKVSTVGTQAETRYTIVEED